MNVSWPSWPINSAFLIHMWKTAGAHELWPRLFKSIQGWPWRSENVTDIVRHFGVHPLSPLTHDSCPHQIYEALIALPGPHALAVSFRIACRAAIIKSATASSLCHEPGLAESRVT